MRIIFLLIVLLHGLIHLLGFVKAFGFKEIKELTLPISKPVGTVWIIATALFLVYGILYFINSKQAWLIGLIAVIVSQILLIFYYWKDAKFGTIPNLTIMIVALVSLASYLLHSEFTSRVKIDFLKNNTLSTDILTEKDIAHLPMVVQKYLDYTKSVGKPQIKNFKAEFVGEIRSKGRVEKLILMSACEYAA